MSPQGQQHWRMWSGDVLLSGHGDLGEDHFSWPQIWWRQCSSHRGEQGGVYQVQYDHCFIITVFWVEFFIGSLLTASLLAVLQSDGRVEVLPRGGRSDQSFPGRIQWGGSTSVAPVLWWKGAWGEQHALNLLTNRCQWKVCWVNIFWRPVETALRAILAPQITVIDKHCLTLRWYNWTCQCLQVFSSFLLFSSLFSFSLTLFYPCFASSPFFFPFPCLSLPSIFLILNLHTLLNTCKTS